MWRLQQGQPPELAARWDLVTLFNLQFTFYEANKELQSPLGIQVSRVARLVRQGTVEEEGELERRDSGDRFFFAICACTLLIIPIIIVVYLFS